MTTPNAGASIGSLRECVRSGCDHRLTIKEFNLLSDALDELAALREAVAKSSL